MILSKSSLDFKGKTNPARRPITINNNPIKTRFLRGQIMVLKAEAIVTLFFLFVSLVGVSAYFFIGYKDAFLLVFTDVKWVAYSKQ